MATYTTAAPNVVLPSREPTGLVVTAAAGDVRPPTGQQWPR